MLLSLDVGFANTGWVIFDKGQPIKWGCIKTEKTKRKMTRVSDDNAARAQYIASELKKIIISSFTPNNVNYGNYGVIAELPTSGSQNARAANQMGIALGIAACLASLLEVPVEWATPTEVKKATTGKKNASKDEMMDTIRKAFPNCDFPKTKTHFEHIADACGVYLASRNGNLVKMFG